MQWLGGVSYSVYLWHWPVIVLARDLARGRLGAVEMLAVLAATAVLAHLTKVHVEDRFRRVPADARPLRTFVAAGAGMAVVGCVCLGLLVEVRTRETDARADVRAALASTDPCLGAGAALTDSCDTST